MSDEETMVEVGIRIDLEEGMQFFGIDAVNAFLSVGRKISEIRAGGAVFIETGDSDEAGMVRGTLGGCQIQVIFEDH